MPLLVICGQPCSGKSTVAEKLADRLRHAGIEVQIKNESSVGTDRNMAYKGDLLVGDAPACQRQGLMNALRMPTIGDKHQCTTQRVSLFTAEAPQGTRHLADARSEKITRSILKATAERALRGERVVILDALNNIKGYRLRANFRLVSVGD